MAKPTGVSCGTVQRIWSARGLKPHLVETFKLSNDPAFEEKLIDVVGLYLNPPEKAVVLCMNEKCQIQALDRTQPRYHEEGPGRNDDPRLPASRHHNPVRGVERAHRERDRAVLRPAPPRRVPALSAHHRHVRCHGRCRST